MIKDFDYTWTNPSKEQVAITGMFASKDSFPKGVKPRQCLEFVAFAEYSLWYLEIKRYADSVYPMDITKDSVRFFLEGCNNICQLVEKGYDPETNSWWKMKTPTTDEEWKEASRFLIAISNAINTLELTYTGQSLIVEMFETFARIALGNDWHERFLGLIEKKEAKKNHNGVTRSPNKKPTSKA